MSGLRDLLTAVFLLSGVFFSLVAGIGIVRLPDLYLRMHAASKTTSLGLVGLLLAILVHFGSYEVITKVLVVILFSFLTSPVGAHMIGRSAYICGVGWYPATTRYDLERAVIVCATRGGPQSERVHQQAIELARERQGKLIFLHVVDTSALGDVESPSSRVLIRQMRALAESILRVAQEQARDAGVTARTEVREGETGSTIEAFIREAQADVLVVGYPHTAAGHEHEAEGRLWRLLNGLQEQDNVRLLVAR